jgi:DNA polymerase III delta subunit
VYSFFLGSEIKEDNLLPCYFFHGGEPFLAYQFVDELKETLISPDIQDYNVEKFNLEDHSWIEIIDSARTLPFFLSPWRIIVVEAFKGKSESLTRSEERVLKDYFASPPSKTLLIIIFSGKLRKTSALYKFFSSYPRSLIYAKEIKPLKEKALFAWMERKLSSQGKHCSHEAKKRLEELSGNDLARVNSELEKIITFVGEKKIIDVDDINQVSGWVRSHFEWEIADSLGKADFERGLRVLTNLFREGTKPEFILGLMVKFFRDIFLAKLWLKEKDMDRKKIFKELRPRIREKYGRFYTEKFREFFSLVERFSLSDLKYALGELEEVDLKIKRSSLAPQILLESFLFDYCRLRKEENVTWRERG